MKLHSPKEYEKRIIRRFLFLPRRIHGEIRWLEFVRIEQYCWFGTNSLWWTDIRFVEKECAALAEKAIKGEKLCGA